MITGFNTDIEHDGVIYHVQTEDKGLETPLILSLVYDRGTILASKRSPYDDLIQNGFDEKALTERLQKQHKLMCAAVRAGRIEELKQMTARTAAAAKNTGAAAAEPAPAAIEKAKMPERAKPEARAKDGGPSISPIPKPSEIMRPEENGQLEPPQFLSKNSRSRRSVPLAGGGAAKPAPKEAYAPAIPAPKDELVWDLPMKIVDDDFVVEVRNVYEQVPMLASDAVEIISELHQTMRAPRPALAIEFLNETNFRAGERKTLQIRVYRGKNDFAVAAAQVMVKVLGSSFRPLIFHAKTDSNGIAVVHLQLPQFRAGRGAVLVRAIHSGEEAELRQMIRQN